MRSLLSLGVFAIVLVVGCAQPQKSEVGGQTSDVRSQTSEVGNQTSEVSARSAALQKQIKDIASEAKGRVGVSAVMLDGSPQAAGGRKTDVRYQMSDVSLASLNAQERFPMQSVYKLPISMAVMKAVDSGKIKLTDKISISKSDLVGRQLHSPIRDRHRAGASLTVDELVRYALAESDGTASDVLMRLAGGPGAVQAYLSELGIKELIVLDTEQALAQDHSLQYRNYATPEAALALLRALHERRGLSESSQAVLLKYLIESRPGANRLKGLLPAGTVVAHKTGTSGTEKGVTAATNDIGIITLPNGKHVAIAVFVADSPAGLVVREGVIAKVAKAVFEAANQ